MHWKTNSKIKNLIAMLPNAIGDKIYYLIQRKFGGLQKKRALNIPNIQISRKIWDLISISGNEPKNKVFFELGTGRVPEIPFYLWLMGSKKIFTVDLQNLLREDLLSEFFINVISNESIIKDYLNTQLLEKRFNLFKSEFYNKNKKSLHILESIMNIEYIPNLDARNTLIKDNTIDYYFSNNVLEHIESNLINEILYEQKRITKNNGLMINYIDYGDHFSHTDDSISSLNFLQYSTNEWSRYGDSKFIYMNRLRHDDFEDIFKKLKYKNKYVEISKENDYQKIIESNNFKLAKCFSNKSNEVLSIIGAWFVHSS
jgi:hypothetical protein